MSITPDNGMETAAWVREAQSGSHPAFVKLHRRYVALVHGVLLSRFRPAIAEELTQECFLVAYKKISQLREPASFAPWMVAIARRMEAPGEQHTEALENHEPLDTANPEAQIDAAKVLNVIRRLPEAYRETLVLRLVEGMSGAEIATATGLSPDSVRVNLHRGMQKLRDALGLQAIPATVKP
ncbi:MAG TPA: sigma-70 family RNA polymerase sigma factor [Steroidobacteraceae bacterium]|nr:sigma-70 family RNA polymerase sigma factor [Steroidobacteraceae bacterium]